MKKILLAVLAALNISGLKAALPSKPPIDLQEKLAWGLCFYDTKVIAEAIKAGADPFGCHKTNLLLKHMNMFKSDLSYITALDNCSPYLVLFYSPNRVKWAEPGVSKRIIDCIEALLKLEISVDKDCADYTFRQCMDFACASYEKKSNVDPKYYRKFFVSNPAMCLIATLSLVSKYQPAPVGFEYVSSFGSKK